MNESDGGAPHSPAAAGNDRSYWLDEPSNVRKIYRGLWLICVALILADLAYQKHPHFDIEGMFGFFGFFGFISYVVLVLAAKELRKFVMREEDYYDR